MRGYGSFGGGYGKRRKILIWVIVLVALIIGSSIFLVIKLSKKDSNLGSVSITVDPMIITDNSIEHTLGAVSYNFKGQNDASSSYSLPISQKINSNDYVLYQYIINNTGNTPVSYSITLDIEENINCEITYSQSDQELEFTENRLSGTVERGRSAFVNIYMKIIDVYNDLSLVGSLGLTISLG